MASTATVTAMAYAEKEDHVGDNERENEDDLEMQGDTNDQNDDLDEDDDKDTAGADLEDDDTVLAAGDQDDLDEDSDDLTAAKGDDDDDADEGGDDDTVEVGADAIQEVSTDDARRVVARPLEDDVRSPVVVEDMTDALRQAGPGQAEGQAGTSEGQGSGAKAARPEGSQEDRCQEVGHEGGQASRPPIGKTANRPSQPRPPSPPPR